MTGEALDTITSLDVLEEAAALAAPFSVELRTRSGAKLVEVDPSAWEDADYAYRAANPRPKMKCSRVLVAEEAILRQLKETKPVVMREYDPQDDGYLIALEQWGDARAFAIVERCLRLELKQGGEVLTKAADRVAALRKLGMSAQMAVQLMAMIQKQGLAREAATVDFSEGDSVPPEGAAA